MAALAAFRDALWLYALAPGGDRCLYRAVQQNRVAGIVELGIASLGRTERLLRAAKRVAGGRAVRYAGFDWFEQRPIGQPPLRLIDTHRTLAATGAETRLIPGGPVAGLPRVANCICSVGLLLISPHAPDDTLTKAWFFVPRMLGPNAVAMRGEPTAAGATRWVSYERERVLDLARLASGSAAA